MLKEFEARMQKSVDFLVSELATIRAGRANPGVLDKVMVDYYGVPTAIGQMAAVSVSEARILVITPWDKGTLKDIEKAILTSDIGVNPQNDGSAIRLIFPQLTEERRREISKGIAKQGEETKVAVRNVRRDANEKMKQLRKTGEITEDDQKNYEKQIQDTTDKFIKEIDAITAAKEKEIMEI